MQRGAHLTKVLHLTFLESFEESADDVVWKLVGTKCMGNFFEPHACEGNIFTRVVMDVKLFDEAEEVAASLFALTDHPVGNEAKKCDGAKLVGRELVIFDHDCCIERRIHGCLEECLHPAITL